MSGNASRRRGRDRELKYIAYLREQGWWAERIDGPADIACSKVGERLHLLQMKSTVTRYSHFGAEDRARLRDEAGLANAACALIWWPRGCGIAKAEWIDEASWPDSYERAA